MRLWKVLVSALLIGLIFTTVLAQSANKPNRSDGGGTITGGVVAQGKPLAGALVTLWEQPLAEPTEHNVTATGRTDDEGNYELKNVPAGNYFISAWATGFVTGKENQIFTNLRMVNAVANGKLERINFDLVPEGVISGTVTDAEGKPVARLPINIFTEVTPAGAGPPKYAKDLRTDDQGRYRITGLPAGRYRVSAGYYPVGSITVFGRAGYRRTFYDGVEDETQARGIDITAGTEVPNVNINVGAPVKTFSVHARIVDSRTGEGVSDIDCTLESYENGKRIGGAHTRVRSNKDGEITLDNVSAGEYLIRVPGGSGIIPRGEIPLAPNILGESKHFEVNDRDVSGVEIRVVRASTLSGFVVVEGAAPANVLAKVPQMRVVAMVIMASLVYASVKPDGSFTFAGLRPGRLQFNFFGPPGKPPLPLRFVRAERNGVTLDQDLEIQSGSEITGIRLILGYANSSIHGVIKLDNNALPQTVRLRVQVLQYGRVVDAAFADQGGEFVVQHLSAGQYLLRVTALNNGDLTIEQPITVSDDQVLEITVVLKSKANGTTTQTTRSPHRVEARLRTAAIILARQPVVLTPWLASG